MSFRALSRERQPVSGLTERDIRVFDEGTERPVTSFQSDVSPTHVVLAAAVGCTDTTPVDLLQGALSAFVDSFATERKRDVGDTLLSLIYFGDRAATLVDKSTNLARFQEAVSRLKRRNNRPPPRMDAMTSALAAALGDAAPPSNRHLRFLVFFSDGCDDSWEDSWDVIGSRLIDQGVVIYGVGLQLHRRDFTMDYSGLMRAAIQSGGRTYKVYADQLETTYKQIGRDIRSHYLLTFRAAHTLDSHRWRTIQVRPIQPGLTLNARIGYCPVTGGPCQKADGTFVGDKPRTFEEFTQLNRNPLLIRALKERLTKTLFEFESRTEVLFGEQASGMFFVEPYPGRSANQKFWWNPPNDMDSDFCWLRYIPDGTLTGSKGSSESFRYVQRPKALAVVDPRFYVNERTIRGPQPASGRRKPLLQWDQESRGTTFQSLITFDLVDPLGPRDSRIQVVCSRPYFLVGENLVGFAIGAVEEALRVKAHPPEP